MLLHFSKYSGAGNDFLLVHAGDLARYDISGVASHLCPRATGVGVDGLITVQSLGVASKPAADTPLFRVRFFNSDGSEFGTCGNGTRCAARFVLEQGLAGPEHRLLTDDGEIDALVTEDGVSLFFSLCPSITELDPALFSAPLQEVPRGEDIRLWLVSLGTPHLVVPVDCAEIPDFECVSGSLRRHPELGPEGANVHMISGTRGEWAIRTFERGVEAETLTCGSGTMAAASILRRTGRAGNDVELVTRSGAPLSVGFLDDGRIRLGGPAQLIFEGKVPLARFSHTPGRRP